jgi:hypothetical protein
MNEPRWIGHLHEQPLKRPKNLRHSFYGHHLGIWGSEPPQPGFDDRPRQPTMVDLVGPSMLAGPTSVLPSPDELLIEKVNVVAPGPPPTPVVPAPVVPAPAARPAPAKGGVMSILGGCLGFAIAIVVGVIVLALALSLLLTIVTAPGSGPCTPANHTDPTCDHF